MGALRHLHHTRLSLPPYFVEAAISSTQVNSISFPGSLAAGDSHRTMTSQ